MAARWLRPSKLLVTLASDQLESLTAFTVSVIRDGSVCSVESLHRFLRHQIRGRGSYLAPHSYGSLAWGLGVSPGSLHGPLRAMGAGFSKGKLSMLRQILGGGDIVEFNSLVQYVSPGHRWLDWRDVAYSFCMNGGMNGGMNGEGAVWQDIRLVWQVFAIL